VSSPNTRSRILRAAWALVRSKGSAAVTLAEIAAAAGVSRQALYLHFDNRVGLLTAMARHHDATSGFADRVAKAATRPPVEGLEHLLRAWNDYIPQILPVARALEAAAATGDEGGAAWHDRMADLRDAFRAAVGRIGRAGLLGPEWTVNSAADWVWASSHLTHWQHLIEERGWSPRRYTDVTVRAIVDQILVR
jgi:AcrR family transcriptional regulator